MGTMYVQYRSVHHNHHKVSNFGISVSDSNYDMRHEGITMNYDIMDYFQDGIRRYTS